MSERAAPTLASVARFVDALLDAARYAGDQNGVLVASSRPVRRLGLAVEAWPEVGRWAGDLGLDALFLHRPWRLDPARLPPGVGVLAYHLAFDERLTTGYNPALAARLGMTDLVPFGDKDGRPLGMVGRVAARPWAELVLDVEREFGGSDTVVAPHAEQVVCVAVAGAMTDGMVRDAVRLGAGAYLTGQLRHPARAAVRDCDVGVVAVGHARGEWWGVRELAAAVEWRWPEVAAVVAPQR